MSPDPPRGQGPEGLADRGPKGGDSNSPDSPEGRGKSRNVTLWQGRKTADWLKKIPLRACACAFR